MKTSTIQFSIITVLLLFIGFIKGLEYYEQDKECPDITCPDLQPVVDSLSFELQQLNEKCALWHKEAEMFRDVVRIEGEINR